MLLSYEQLVVVSLITITGSCRLVVHTYKTKLNNKLTLLGVVNSEIVEFQLFTGISHH